MKVIYCGTADIHVCPNGCASLLATVATVQQDWKVDAEGSFVDVMTDAVQTVHEPDNGNTWTCLNCGAEAELYENAAKYYVALSDAGNDDFAIYIVDKETAFCSCSGEHYHDGLQKLEKSLSPGFLMGKTGAGRSFSVRIDQGKSDYILSISC